MINGNYLSQFLNKLAEFLFDVEKLMIVFCNNFITELLKGREVMLSFV